MKRLLNVRKLCLWTVLGTSSLALTIGTTCPLTGDNTRPIVPPGNRPPRIIITSVTTPFGNNFAEVGESVSIAFSGEDAEDAAVARVFASTSGDPMPAQEIPILGGFPIGPGTGNGVATWDTTGVAPGIYNLFAEIDDRTLDPFTGAGNPPVRTVSAAPLQLGPVGSKPTTSPPQLVFLSPTANLGLTSEDEFTIRYIYADIDSQVTVTLLLDKDLNPNNDDINNPGDPLNPASKIILLPSLPRRGTDPTFDGDPPPPDDPNNPPVQPDSLEIRTNPRILPQTVPGILPFPVAPLAGEEKAYLLTIDFSQVPPSSSPYFVRADVRDGADVKRFYAVGSIGISSSAVGTVAVENIGFAFAGARFHGFTARENLGSDFVSAADTDMDSVDDFLIAGRFASPRNRPESGAAYLLFGRRKLPFPVDTDGNGRPDGGVRDANGDLVEFPEAPEYLPNPYEPQNVGRFGGTISINSTGSFFRGTVYAAAAPIGDTPVPPRLTDPANPLRATAGLSSLARVDMTGDDIKDFVFGMPYIASPKEHHDDDPVDGGCDVGAYGDSLPNFFNCSQFPNDDITDRAFIENPPGSGDFFPIPIDVTEMGIVVMVDATNDLRNVFRRFVDIGMAGQFDPGPQSDHEDVIRDDDDTPRGVRWRGGWFSWQPVFPDPIVNDTEYGRTVSSLPDISGDLREEMMLSAPNVRNGRGGVQIWLSQDFQSEIFYSDGVRSLPSYDIPVGDTCNMLSGNCIRGFRPLPVFNEIVGEMPGDHFGFARSAGQLTQDGVAVVPCGSPDASRNGLVSNGIMYVLFPSLAGFGDIDLALNPPPHLKVVGSHNDDRFGEIQVGIGNPDTEDDDLNGDGLVDIAFSAESYDGTAGPDCGYVGVIFGDRPLTGEQGFAPEDVGTHSLPGIRFEGVAAGALAGHDIDFAGDFNADGFGEILISSPGETRIVDGQTRFGVAYLIFGGTHLDPAVNGRTNNVFNLAEVGQPQLPGIVFVGRLVPGAGPETEATIATVGGVGDVDGDGFDDVFVGAPTADFVFPNSPNQRRVDAGEVYLIYGNKIGSNNLNP